VEISRSLAVPWPLRLQLKWQAMHAQKYFIRHQLSRVKDKRRRPTIHGITAFNISDSYYSYSIRCRWKSFLDQFDVLSSQQDPTGIYINY
jgi:hypothetical protein